MRTWQGAQLRRLVREVYAAIPLWKQYFDLSGVAPESINSVYDLQRLPVTDKQFYSGKMTEEYVDTARMTGAYWHTTSGTSGRPFTFLATERSYAAKYVDLATLRFVRWKEGWHRDLHALKVARIKMRGPSLRHRLHVAVRDFLTTPQAVLKQIESFKPDILTSYPSILLESAQLLRQDPTIAHIRPRYVVSFGEMLTPAARQLIGEAFQAEVYDRYAIEEVGAIGSECAKHDGFHIHMESIVVEVVDREGKCVPEGERGRVVVTDLFNSVMPFIRYDTGDEGRISTAPCSCGLRAPRVWITGRYTASLTFSGRRIHHLEFDAALDGFMDRLLQYQIAKLSEDHLVARITPGPKFETRVLEQVEQALRPLLGKGVDIQVDVVPRLAIPERGKSKIVVDESL
ncbi:MAG TPA: hypothetical protein VHD38_00085 [Candidatus Paceibacterota bacterium]|nr:hypothetical protein [Candidatus Paceibacterota bacterium]